MAHAPPPVPHDQQNDALNHTGARPQGSKEVKHDPAGGASAVNLREQGQAGDINQNTHNQGHQQDR